MSKLLVIEDDAQVARVLTRFLSERGAACTRVAAVEEASRSLRMRHRFDLILLDLQLPGRPGMSFLSEIRDAGDSTPVIILTGLSEEDQRVSGLCRGADDYVTKPFSEEELWARIEAVLRRSKTIPRLCWGGLTLDMVERTVSSDKGRAELTTREFHLIQCLMEAQGAPVSRKRLLGEVWSIEFEPETKLVEVAVTRLRKKLAAAGLSGIESLPNLGYRLLT